MVKWSEPENRRNGESGNRREKEKRKNRKVAERINSYKDLRVYQNAMDAAMKIFQLTKRFPQEEKYSMVDQIRRSSRSVCANIGEAWRKRRYQAAFVAKLSDAESEACETQVWIEFARRCGYFDAATTEECDKLYDQILSQLVRMIDEAEKWLIK
jgi:four helix bundle protein